MATYYTIQTWNRGTFESQTFNLYETFDEACDTIEGYIRAYVDFNESDLDKIKPNREEKRENIRSWNRVFYLKMPSGDEQHIARMVVAPKKQTYEECVNQMKIERHGDLLLMTPKKYVYQYFRQTDHGSTTNFIKYNTLDEVCDAMDKELFELHDAIEKTWKPRMTREEFKEYMDDHSASTYDFFNTDTFVLIRKEA